MNRTLQQYQAVITHCRGLFLQKAQDYGTAWTILRLPSLTDQIYIKAGRIRSIQEKAVNRVGEPLENEFVGIINYCVMALLLLEHEQKTREEIDALLAENGALPQAYDAQVRRARETMEAKNHDYGEAWRNMRVSSITDLILMKILRLKQIEDNQGQTLVSEGRGANYIDMLNYAVFSLILLGEAGESSIPLEGSK